jgi:hypothetical protein
MSNPNEDISASMDRYEERASRLSFISVGNLALGAVLTGAAAYSGAKGSNGVLAFDSFAATLNYSIGAFNLANANRLGQKAAALQGALAQHELASGVTSPEV